MDFIFKYPWVVFIAMNVFNGIVFKVRSQKYITANPDLRDGYNKLITGWLFYGNIPWVIMAVGDLSGMTNGIWEYLHPRSMNPAVLVLHGSIIGIWILGSNWIYRRDGAAFLARHPGLIRLQGPGLNNVMTSAKAIKIVWTIVLAGGIAGMALVWFWNAPPVPGY
ncbi:hypothetical protein [Mangrovibacterium lignilyticum]|uniref:hypothetical protein n=1 Tax=Mangrovibacterium lignilyticum TaxID=2668052 RepID=UPI0013D64A2E|nr:hypothetical protein [Mangrovibacterium lignilyticum]